MNRKDDWNLCRLQKIANQNSRQSYCRPHLTRIYRSQWPHLIYFDMKQKIYRIIHAILESPEMVEKLKRRYAYLLDSDRSQAETHARKILEAICRDRSKPQKQSLQKIVTSWKEETWDTRDDLEVSVWLLLPYDHNLLIPYYGSRKS